VGVEPRFGRRDFGVKRFAGDRLRPAAGGQRKSCPQNAAGGDERQGRAAAGVLLIRGVVVVCRPDFGVGRIAAQRGHSPNMTEDGRQVKSNRAYSIRTRDIALERVARHPGEPLDLIWDWWMKSRATRLADNRYLTLNEHESQDLNRKYDPANTEHRKAWMRLFILGLIHKMSLKLGQHRGFLELWEQERWLDVFVQSPPEPTAWLASLDRYLERQMARIEYFHWIKNSAVSTQSLDDWMITFVCSWVSSAEKPLSCSKKSLSLENIKLH